MKEQLALLPGLLAAHLGLTLVALALGLLVSVPLGVAVTRVRRLEGPVLGAASVIQTIPSLALLAFMVPALAALGARSIGYLPALLGLFLYSLLPVLRNTVAGLSAIDPSVLEAARAVGMTPGEQLRRVELPLALPVIVAGVRTAAVWTVGTATLSTPVGAPSLGDYIFSGLQTRNLAAVSVGCVASAALALLLDGLVRALAAGVTRRRRALVGLSGAGFVALALFAAWPVIGRARTAGPAVTIGAKTFTEQYILSRILAGRITAATGLSTRTLDSLGSTVAFDALRTGQIDAYVDYSGTLWTMVLRHDGTGADRATVLRETGRELHERYGITLAAALGFEDSYAFVVRRDDAQRLGLRRLSDLGPAAAGLRVAGDYELFQRPEWRDVVRVYGLPAFRERRSMDPSLLYEALRAGQVDVIGANSTDGRIATYDLVALEDDRRAIPPYDAVVLVSPRLGREHPEAAAALRGLSGTIDADRMRRMNAAVDDGKEDPSRVAARFLADLPR